MRNFNQSSDFPYMNSQNSCCQNKTDRNMNFPNFNFTTSVNGNPVMSGNSIDPNMMNFLGNNTNLSGNMMDMSTLDMSSEVTNSNMNSELFDSYEGFMRGNIFKNMYVPYKNYRPMKLMPNSEQAESLLRVNELAFASHDARLYLDVYPNDREMIRVFNNFRNAANQAVLEYESKYGPLEWNALSDPNMFRWVSTTWPWEMEVN